MPIQLRETAMDPAKKARTLRRITVKDGAAAEAIFESADGQ
jgi:DNA gyrase/topoisomerase IV subunit B